MHTIEVVGHVAASSHSHPFDTALRAYSGQAVGVQEATSGPACAGHADRPGIRVAECCPVINRLLLWPRGDRQLRGHAVGSVKRLPTRFLPLTY